MNLLMNKKNILKDLREYSSDEIAEAIREGVVTMYELSKSGNLTPLMRKRLEEKLANNTPAAPEKATVQSQTDETLPNTDIPQIHDVKPSPVQNENNGAGNITFVPEATIPEAIVPVDYNENSNKAGHAEEKEEEEHPESDGVETNTRMFRNPFSFHGRIRRLEYGLSLILFYILCFFVNIISLSASNGPDSNWILILIFLSLGYWFLWAQGAKRCHDRNHSGWYQLIPFYELWMLFADGDWGKNDYGDNPKGLSF